MGWIILIILIFVVLFIMDAYVKSQSTKALKQRYELALRGKDKQVALAAGRAYYSELRGGNLTIYDEQAIANDLAAME